MKIINYRLLISAYLTEINNDTTFANLFFSLSKNTIIREKFTNDILKKSVYEYFLSQKDKFENIYAKDNNIPFGIAMFDNDNLIGFLDMFSGGALGAVCYLLNVPFVSVRKISDNADDVSVNEYTNSVVSDVTAFSDIVLKVLEKL